EGPQRLDVALPLFPCFVRYPKRGVAGKGDVRVRDRVADAPWFWRYASEKLADFDTAIPVVVRRRVDASVRVTPGWPAVGQRLIRRPSPEHLAEVVADATGLQVIPRKAGARFFAPGATVERLVVRHAHPPPDHGSHLLNQDTLLARWLYAS